MELICAGNQLIFNFGIPETDQTWQITATDPFPRTGSAGVHMGTEPYTQWEWFEVATATGTAEETAGPVRLLTGLSASPNPSAGQVILTVPPMQGSGSLEVFDLTGRLIFTIPYSSDGSFTEVLWDGRGDDGVRVSSGVYLVRDALSAFPPTRLVRLD